MKPIRSPLVLAVLAALALAACGSAAASHHGKGAAVQLRATSLGKVLTDARGRTLYLFEADKGKTSSCYGACAGFWPAALAKGKLTVGAGLQRSLVGVTMRKDGARQLTYAGHPLYLFKLDAKAGQTKGEGLDDFGGGWYVVSAKGAKIEAASPQTSNGGTTTTPPPDSGYGY